MQAVEYSLKMANNIKKMSFDQKIFLGAIFIIPLIITPGLSYDAINIPKFIALVAFGSLLASTLFISGNLAVFRANKVLTTFLIAFVFIIFTNPFIVNRNILLQFYGGESRHTGVITNVFLVVFMAGSIYLTNKETINNFGKVIVIVGIISGVYGILQDLGLDPVTWDNPYNEVMGFVGNPNQQSSLMGICSVVIFSFFLSNSLSMARRLSLAILFIFSIYVIYCTNSTQGLIVSVAGCAFALWIKIKFLSVKKVWKISFLTLTLGIFIYGILDIFRITNGNYLYKESVSFRGDFWRTALKMTKENPLTGVGLDGYADWYRRSRDSEAATRLNLDSVSDSPHNIFLDYLSAGGIPLFLAFLLINILTLLSLVNLYRKLSGFNLEFVILGGVWIAYLLQGLISPIHISLSIWGWVASGLILGLDLGEKSKQVSIPPKKKITTANLQTISPLLRFGGLVMAVVIALPIYRMDHTFRVAFKTAQVQDFLNASNAWPKYPIRLATIGNVLLQNNLTDLGKPVLLEAVRINPNSYPSWLILSKYPNLTNNEKEEVQINLRRLEPRFEETT
jgi:O-antigen ligase